MECRTARTVRDSSQREREVPAGSLTGLVQLGRAVSLASSLYSVGRVTRVKCPKASSTRDRISVELRTGQADRQTLSQSNGMK